MKTLTLLFMFLFVGCKEDIKKSEHRKMVEYADSSFYAAMTKPITTILPSGTLDYRSIETKKLDTVIALLKKQNKLLTSLKVTYYTQYPTDSGHFNPNKKQKKIN